MTHKAITGQDMDDHLAENPFDKEYMPLTTYFPNKEALFVGGDILDPYPGWRMFFDGTANIKGVVIRAFIVSESGQHYPILANVKFMCTNNMVEYDVCIFGIRMAVHINMKELWS